jgi:DNA polymerase-1
VQIERIHALLEAFNVPVFEREGYEADDLLGTLAEQAGDQRVSTLIVTGDRDLLQLVGPRVRVQLSGRRLHEAEIYDAEAVRARYGVTPDQFVDYKALVGDKSDNIPGVTGIGEKGAAQLLQHYGTLEAMLAQLEELTPARSRTALERGREAALLSQRLARIERQTPVTLDLDRCRTADYDRGAVLALFRELEFNSLIDRLPAPAVAEPGPTSLGGHQMAMFPGETASATPRPPTTEARLITTPEALEAFVAELAGAAQLSVDVESTGVDPVAAELLGVALTARTGQGAYVALNAPGADREALLALLRPLLADARIPKVAHNAKYDLGMLRRYGVNVANLGFDTMLAEWLCDASSRSLGLKNLAFARLGIEMQRIEELIGTGKKQISMAEVPVEQVAAYAVADVDMTLRLVAPLEEELRAKQQWALFSQIELPLSYVLMDMEQAGVRLDVDALAALGTQLETRLGELTAQIQDFAGREFNVDSPQQLSEVLFTQLGLPTHNVPRTRAGKYSTAADVLEGLRGQHPIVELILEQRQLAKLKGTYVDALPALINPRTGRVHTDYNQCGAVTGRVSSANPNLQNIPVRTELGRRVRRAFVADPGFSLLSADYSQIELRILAHIADDAALKEAFARDEDIHRSAAAAIYGVPVGEVTREQRQVGKTVNFAVTYGQSAYGLAQVTGLAPGDAQAVIDAYFARFPGVRHYVEQTKRRAAEHGYVETLLGRRRYFPALQGPLQRGQLNARLRAEREAINAPIQGSSADIMKIAMIRLYGALSERHPEARLILQVHDELVLEVPAGQLAPVAELAVATMAGAFVLDVPLKVEAKAGPNWEEMTPVR